MPKLAQEDQISRSHRSIALILREYGIDRFSFRSATTGISNTTLIVTLPEGRRVLRVYRQGNKSLADIERELDFASYVSRVGIAVPALVPTGSGRSVAQVQVAETTWRAILMEFVEGNHPRSYGGSLIPQLSELHARMHLLGRAYAQEKRLAPALEMQSYITAKEHRQLQEYIAADPARPTAAFISRAVANRLVFDPSLPFGYNHLDLDAGNILVQEGKIKAVLDFDDLVCTPLVQCLGNTLWHVLYKNEAAGETQLAEYLSSYQSVRKLSPAELDALPKVMLFRNYVLGMLETVLWGGSEKMLTRYIRLEKRISALRFSHNH